MAESSSTLDCATGNPLNNKTVHFSPGEEPDTAANLVAGGMSDRIREFDWSTTPLGDRAGWPQSLQTVVRVLLTSRFAMWMGWGPDLTFLYNDAYARMTLGKKHPWALGKPAREVWAEIWPDIGPRIQRVLDTSEATWDEALLLFLERSGYREETYHTFSYSPLTDEQGQVSGNLCVVSEETNRIISERRLRTLRELLERTFEQAKTLERACRAAAETLARSRHDIPFALIYLLDDEGKHARLMEAIGIDADSAPAPREIEIDGKNVVWHLDAALSSGHLQMAKDLELKFGRLTAGPWSDDFTKEAAVVPLAKAGTPDRPAGFLIAGISPRIRLDAKYIDFLQLAAGHVATAIANARALEEERKRAETLAELDRAKTTFFSNVSHELRTPLTLILGPTEDALNASRPLGGRDLELVHRNEVRLLKLVNTLLDFSRIEAGRIEASFEPTDLSSFTAELAGVFQSAIERAGLRLVIDAGSLAHPVYVDREMWEKIILNLLSNAFKCTFDGEIRVTVEGDQESARVIVRDTGTGIAADQLPRLFERFHRIDGARRRTHEGSGIGLALVHELVKMHGGSIHVESELGKGTSFAITIPFGAGHLPQNRIAARQQRADFAGGSPYVTEAMSWLGTDGEGIESPGIELDDLPRNETRESSPGRVLLVDDNQDMREYVQRLLTGHFDVVAAANGRAALEIARRDPPDLVLSDVMMPQMDGFELLAAIREDKALESIPVILLSARAGEEARIEGLERRADDYLVKPFSARELVARVRTHLELARVRERAVAALREDERRFREIIDALPAAIYTTDADGLVTHFNPAAVEFAGRTPLVGSDRWCIAWKIFRTDGTPLPHDQCPMALSLRENRIVRGEEAMAERPDGSRVWFMPYPTPLHDAAGRLVGGINMMVDITERKRSEEALRRSEKIAAVGRLAATMAHEINNPLESVTNLLYLARKDPGISERAQRQLELADQELDRVAHVARQTLGFYRDQAAPSWFNVSQAIDELVEVYRYKLRNRDIELVKELDPAIEVFASPGEFRQVLSNLLVNAVDALPAAHGKIVVRATRGREWNRAAREGVRIAIADSGCGIAPEHRSKIFESFYTTKQEIGTGLGLWLTRNIVEKHGGMIRVHSLTRPGKSGTVFSVFWPSDTRTLHREVPA